MNKTEIIIFSLIIVFQISYLVYIIKLTINAFKELKETLERGSNKDAKGDR